MKPSLPQPGPSGAGRTLAKNALWSFAGTALPMAVGLAAIPVLISNLGVDRFGVITIAWAVAGYLSLVDLGLGRALTKLVAERKASADARDLAHLIWTALALLLVLGVVGGVLVWCLSPVLVERTLRIPEALRRESLVAFRVLAVGMPAVVGGAGARGILEARQRFGVANAVRASVGAWTFLSPCAALPFTHDLGVIVGLLVAGRYASWAVQLAFCRGDLFVPGTPRRPRRDHVASLLSLGGWMTVSNVVSPLMVYFDRFLLGSVLSVAAVAYYVTPYEVLTKFWVVPAAIASVLFPSFAELFRGDAGRMASLLERCQLLILVALFPLTIFAAAFSHELLALWLGPLFAAQSAGVARWLAAGILVNGVTQVPFSLIQASGRADLTAKLHLAELPLYVVGIWWLVVRAGIEGAAIAWTLRIVVDTAAIFWATSRLFPATRAALMREAGTASLAVAILALATVPHGLVARGAFTGVGIVFLAAWIWTRGLRADDRAWLRATLRGFRFSPRGSAA